MQDIGGFARPGRECPFARNHQSMNGQRCRLWRFGGAVQLFSVAQKRTERFGLAVGKGQRFD